MQLKLIQNLFRQYEAYLRKPVATERLYIWESQRIFQENWNMASDNWAEMFDRSLQNSHTRRLWLREAYEPKKRMLDFVQLDPGFVQHMFFDLFNEEKAVDGRASRFVFYCEQMMENYLEKYPLSKESSHYHDDNYHMVFLYLSFRYPDKYCLHDAEAFRRLLQAVGSQEIPKTNDVERYAKVCQTLWKWMEKDTQIMELHQQRLQPGLHYTETSLMPVYDMMMAIL